jgi:flagellar hook-associated protein 2
MASITSPGIGSGLDVNGIISKLMAVEQQPLTKLDTKEASYQAKLSAMGTLKGAFSAVQTAAQALTSTSLFGAKSATSSDTSVLTSSANTAATAGTYSVGVVKLAQAQSIASQGFASLSTDLIALGGSNAKIKIELGTYTAATTTPVAPATYVPDPAKAAVTIDIDATSSSLEDIRDKINAANAGVSANIVNDGSSSGYKLVINSTSTGAKSSIRLTTLDSTGTTPLPDNVGLSQIAFDPLASSPANRYSISKIAQDAELTIDGLTITRSSNTISDVITGVTLTAIKAGTSTLTAKQDTGSVATAVNAFVKAYNDSNSQLRDLTSYNSETKQAALLFGDSTARGLQSAMKDMINYVFPGGSSGLRSLSDIGVSIQRDGSLQFNSTKLTSALESSPSKVSDLFTSTSASSLGLASKMNASLKSMLSTSGLFASRTDGINRSITDLTSQRERLALRLTGIEKRYRAQFSALDTLVSSMQQTSQYLTQQLANLPSTSSN